MVELDKKFRFNLMKIIFFGVSAGVFSAAAHAADISNNETGFKKVWNRATVSYMNLIDNIDFTTDFNAKAGFEKRVAGNGFSLNGNGVDGVLEANGKTVSLTNLTVKGFANKDKGILYAENANIFATDAVFTDNAAAIRFKSNETAANKLTLRAENSDVVFSQNGLSALNVRGGAVFMDGGELTATANDGKRIDFSNNTAHQGGALYIENVATAALANALFKSNEATLNNGYGGAIYAASAVLTMDRTDFVNNKASQSGGAVYADRSVLEVDHAEFSGNTATVGGALNGYGAQMTIKGNSSFADNTATTGGAIFANLSDLKITGGEFAGNKANLGGAIYLQNSSAELTDADFTGNTASNGAAIYFKATASGKTLKINAENKDVTFKNNGTSGLFVYSTKPTSVTLSAAAGKTLTFDDAISFNGQTATYRPRLILDGAGTVVLNGALTGRFSLDVNAADAVLNLGGDNSYDKLEVVKLTGNSVLKVKVDFNAADGSSDFLDVDSIESNGSAALTDINITADGDADSLQWLKGTGIGGVADASADALKIMTSGGWTYTFVKTGLGTFGVSRMKDASLPAAIADETIARFDLAADYASPADLGVLQGAGRSFVLDGNGHALNANGKNGVTVASGQTIKIENVSAVDGFDVFAVNNGTLVFDGTVGLNGKIAGTGTTIVDGTLNLSADIENSVRVSAAGVLDAGGKQYRGRFFAKQRNNQADADGYCGEQIGLHGRKNHGFKCG